MLISNDERRCKKGRKMCPDGQSSETWETRTERLRIVAPRVFSCANWEETRPHTHIYLHIEKEILDEQTKSRPAFPRIHVGGEQVGKAEAALEDECGPFIA